MRVTRTGMTVGRPVSGPTALGVPRVAVRLAAGPRGTGGPVRVTRTGMTVGRPVSGPTALAVLRAAVRLAAGPRDTDGPVRVTRTGMTAGRPVNGPTALAVLRAAVRLVAGFGVWGRPRAGDTNRDDRGAAGERPYRPRRAPTSDSPAGGGSLSPGRGHGRERWQDGCWASRRATGCPGGRGCRGGGSPPHRATTAA